MGDISTFEWGKTPTVFIAQAHNLIVCPVWYEERGDKEISMYDMVELPLNQRTPRAKKYQAFEALGTRALIPVNFLFTLGHLFYQKESRLYIVDGYPIQILDEVRKQLFRIYREMGDIKKVPIALQNRINTLHTDTLSDWNNEYQKWESYCNEREEVLIDLARYDVKKAIPELAVYNDLVGKRDELLKQEQYKRGMENYTRIMGAPPAPPDRDWETQV